MTTLKDLCEGESEHIQQKIKAAYWQGCSEGIILANSTDAKVYKREDNVVYLKTLDEERPVRWEPPEL